MSAFILSERRLQGGPGCSKDGMRDMDSSD